LDQIAPSKWPGEWGVRTIVSEWRLALPKVSKVLEAEVKGWVIVNAGSGCWQVERVRRVLRMRRAWENMAGMVS